MAYEMHVFKQIKINSNNFRREVLFYRHHCNINEKNMKKKILKIFLSCFSISRWNYLLCTLHTRQTQQHKIRRIDSLVITKENVLSELLGPF